MIPSISTPLPTILSYSSYSEALISFDSACKESVLVTGGVCACKLVSSRYIFTISSVYALDISLVYYRMPFHLTRHATVVLHTNISNFVSFVVIILNSNEVLKNSNRQASECKNIHTMDSVIS